MTERTERSKQKLNTETAGEAPEVILLNGPSSAGKSSISRALQKLLAEAGREAAIISLDDYMGLVLEPGEEIWEDDVFEVVPPMCRDIEESKRQGRTVIIDHVITSERIFTATAAAGGQCMKTVLVSCSRELLREREAARGDRFIGSAETSLEYLYPKDGYDLCIDSGKTSPEEAAQTIAGRFFTADNIIAS